MTVFQSDLILSNYFNKYRPAISFMAARPATFTGFDPYKLTGVRVTDRELGHGSYATVLELEYMGLKCAGKKIHELLLRQGDATYTVRRFEEECRLLSQVRHPNIVQFLGVYFQQGERAPILVMEFLPTNLTSCIEQYGILPKEISYSILHDVALGLCYLHSQTPPIIHRDLSSNNVLLTPNMTAKISDLGVARILNLTPLQVSRMTQTPGTPAYMPPEVMVADPKYNTSVDEFSYGIMMIHIYSGWWPEPQVGQIRIEEGKLIPVTEAERREIFFKAIEDDHPLMDLIHRCIDNDPQMRPHTSEIVRQIRCIATRFPASFANRLDMLKQIEADREEKRSLIEEREKKDRIIKENEDDILVSRENTQALTEEGEIKDIQISSLKEEIRTKEEKGIAEMDRLKLVHSSEVEQLRLQVRELNTEYELMKAENEAEITEFKCKVAALETQIENNAKILFQEREQSARQWAEEQGKYDMQLKKEREQYEMQLTKEREVNRKLIANCQDLQSDLSKSRSEIVSLAEANSKLQSDIAKKDTNIFLKDASAKRKDSELEAKSTALKKKDATISAMSEQLTNTREYLAIKKKVSIYLPFDCMIYPWCTQGMALVTPI